MVKHTAFLPNITPSSTTNTAKGLHDYLINNTPPTSEDVLLLFSPFDQSESIRSSTCTSSTLPTFTIASQQQQQQLPEQTFEPIAPDTSALIGFGLVVVLSVVASFVWANEVVPVSRTKLALSKRDGDVKKYLDELKEGGNYDNKIIDENSSTAVVASVENSIDAGSVMDTNNDNGINKKTDDGRDFERWLFTDWLDNNKSAGKPGRKKEPALPILKNAKWNSGDNPVLVTFAMMMVGVVIASVTERAGGSF